MRPISLSFFISYKIQEPYENQFDDLVRSIFSWKLCTPNKHWLS